MPNLDKMREQFEAAITAEISAQLMAIHPAITETDAHMMIDAHGWLVRKGDTYESPVSAMGWWAWQKSRADAVVDLTLLIHQDDDDSLAYYLAGDVELAIRSAGVGLAVTP